MFTRTWWQAAGERAAKSAAQGFVLTFGSDVTGWLSLDWKTIVTATVGMGVLSLATSIITTPNPHVPGAS